MYRYDKYWAIYFTNLQKVGVAWWFLCREEAGEDNSGFQTEPAFHGKSENLWIGNFHVWRERFLWQWVNVTSDCKHLVCEVQPERGQYVIRLTIINSVLIMPKEFTSGHLVLGMSVCESVAINFNLGNNFLTIRDREFMFNMHTLFMNPFKWHKG